MEQHQSGHYPDRDIACDMAKLDKADALAHQRRVGLHRLLHQWKREADQNAPGEYYGHCKAHDEHEILRAERHDVAIDQGIGDRGCTENEIDEPNDADGIKSDGTLHPQEKGFGVADAWQRQGSPDQADRVTDQEHAKYARERISVRLHHQPEQSIPDDLQRNDDEARCEDQRTPLPYCGRYTLAMGRIGPASRRVVESASPRYRQCAQTYNEVDKRPRVDRGHVAKNADEPPAGNERADTGAECVDGVEPADLGR